MREPFYSSESLEELMFGSDDSDRGINAATGLLAEDIDRAIKWGDVIFVFVRSDAREHTLLAIPGRISCSGGVDLPISHRNLSVVERDLQTIGGTMKVGLD